MSEAPAATAAPLMLPDTMDMTAARPLRDAFLQARGSAVSIDGSRVNRIGGQCLQVLLAAEAAWAADGQPFQLAIASSGLIEGLKLMGASHLAVDAAAPADTGLDLFNTAQG